MERETKPTQRGSPLADIGTKRLSKATLQGLKRIVKMIDEDDEKMDLEEYNVKLQRRSEENWQRIAKVPTSNRQSG